MALIEAIACLLGKGSYAAIRVGQEVADLPVTEILGEDPQLGRGIGIKRWPDGGIVRFYEPFLQFETGNDIKEAILLEELCNVVGKIGKVWMRGLRF